MQTLKLVLLVCRDVIATVPAEVQLTGFRGPL
jgi:hypothetical protein